MAGRTKAQPGRENLTVTVDFTPMAFLLEELKKRAEAELRQIGPQILWELSKAIGGNRDAQN